MPSDLPDITRERCIRAANQICNYYEATLANDPRCREDPVWNAMLGVALEWRSLVERPLPSESELDHIESTTLAIKNAGTTWWCLSNNIDIWVRSQGRAGLGIWHGDPNRFPATILTLWDE